MKGRRLFLVIIALAALFLLEPRVATVLAEEGTAQVRQPLNPCVIKGADLKYMGSPTPELDLYGIGFGATQGKRSVQVDGKALSAWPGWSVLHWSDTSVTLIASQAVPWEHTYQFAITNLGNVISNVFSKQFLYVIDQVNPQAGLPGTKVNVYIWALPATQGTYVLKLGTYNFTILTWKGNNTGPLEVQVPAAPKGTYDVFLKKGTAVISKKSSFTVKSAIIIKPPALKRP